LPVTSTALGLDKPSCTSSNWHSLMRTSSAVRDFS
jgi:hypothetical protein